MMGNSNDSDMVTKLRIIQYRSQRLFALLLSFYNSAKFQINPSSLSQLENNIKVSYLDGFGCLE